MVLPITVLRELKSHLALGSGGWERLRGLEERSHSSSQSFSSPLLSTYFVLGWESADSDRLTCLPVAHGLQSNAGGPSVFNHLPPLCSRHLKLPSYHQVLLILLPNVSQIYLLSIPIQILIIFWKTCNTTIV